VGAEVEKSELHRRGAVERGLKRGCAVAELGVLSLQRVDLPVEVGEQAEDGRFVRHGAAFSTRAPEVTWIRQRVLVAVSVKTMPFVAPLPGISTKSLLVPSMT